MVYTLYLAKILNLALPTSSAAVNKSVIASSFISCRLLAAGGVSFLERQFSGHVGSSHVIASRGRIVQVIL